MQVIIRKFFFTLDFSFVCLKITGNTKKKKKSLNLSRSGTCFDRFRYEEVVSAAPAG